MTEISIAAVSHAATSFVSNGRPNEGYAMDYQLLGGSLEQFTLSSGWSMRIVARSSPLKHSALCLIGAIFSIIAGLVPVISFISYLTYFQVMR